MPDVREKQFQILLAKEKADFLFKMDMEQEEYKGTIVPALMDRKVMRLEDKLRREAMPSQSPTVTALPGGEPKGVNMYERLWAG